MSKNFSILIILSLILTSGFIRSMEEQPNILENRNAKQFYLHHSKISPLVGSIKEVKYNSTGTKLAVIGKNCTFAEIWDIDAQKFICKLTGHKEAITCIDWHPNTDFSNIAITGSKDGMTKLWNTISGQCIASFRIPNAVMDYKGPIETISFANASPALFISGHSNGLPCIRFFKSNSNSKFMSCLDFTTESSPIYHASFQKSGKLVCVAHTDGSVKIFERPKKFSKKHCTEQWKLKLIHSLFHDEKLESWSISSNYIFLRIKNSDTGIQTCDLLHLEDTSEEEMDSASLAYCLDYCKETNNGLSQRNADEQLFEFTLDPLLDNRENLIFTFTSPIKSATYNTSGNQILVITEKDSHILENKDNKWSCIYSTSTQSKILLHPNRHDLFISISQQAENDNVIWVWKTCDLIEKSSTIATPPRAIVDPMEQDRVEQLMLLKRKRNSFEKAKNASMTKRSKILSNSDEDNFDDISTEAYDSFSEKEDDVLTEEHETSSDEDNDNFFIRMRHKREIHILLNMHELVTIDQEILSKSLIEVVTTHTDEVIQKYLNCTVNCNLNEQDTQGKTALFIATASNKESIVKLLAERGADINIADRQGLSPLHIAIKKGYLAIAKYLIAQQALVNKQTVEGETALHLAIKNMDFDAIKAILASDDVDLNLLDKHSNSPLSLAITSNNSELIKLFGEKLKKH